MKTWKKALAGLTAMAICSGASVALTAAYLTDRDSEANVFTVGDVKIDLTEDFDQGATLIPGVKIEKDVKIENTGKNDAWVWAKIALPAVLDNADPSKNVIHFNYTKDPGYNWTWTDDKGWMVEEETIDNITYNVYTVLYDEVLAPGEVTDFSAMFQVYLDTKLDIDPNGDWHLVYGGNVTDINWNSKVAPIMYVSAYGIQEEGFTTVQEAYTAYGVQWGDQGAGDEWGTPATVVEVADDAALEAALTTNEKNVIVELTADVTYDVAAWAVNGMGGDITESVTINGNGNTLTFNQTNSDWNNVVTNNGATLILSNVNITNAGHNNGPWNRHDINFACDVVMNNVTSDKAFAFKAGATLKDVTIDDANTSDTYAIWVQPNGQTVTLDGVVIDMLDCTDGRGLKIDEQYVGTPEKVTLIVKDTTFKTEEKSAILVKSKAGADITLDNVDISGVAADSVNAVWVDEASAAYADLVTVTGGTKVLE